MTLNSRLISQQFAALWEQEVDKASQAALAAEIGAPPAPRGAVPHASLSQAPAGSAPQVIVRHRRHATPSGVPELFGPPPAAERVMPGLSVTVTPSPEAPAKTPRVFRLAPEAAPADIVEIGGAARPALPGAQRPLRARRSSRPGASVRAPSPPRIIIAPVPRTDLPVEKPEPRDAPASRATGDALLARLEALQPLQRLAALLLAGDEQLAALPAQQISDLTASAWQQCNPGLLHRLHPAGYWDAVAAACPLAASTLGSAAAMRAISLVGLLVRANRPEVLECLDPDCTDPYLAAAEIDAAGSTRTLSALGLALDFGCDSFIAWSARHWSRLDPQPKRHEKVLTRHLSAAIESWSAGTRPASAMRMAMAMLQMGALLDRRHLLLLASRDSTGNAVEAWDDLARAAHDTDQHGLAALQILVSAATFNYELTPRPGGANPMAHYAAGDHPRAVEMFMQSGFDPLLPGVQELSPRDHGARYLASRALAAIDLYLAQNRLEALRQSAENLRELDGLLGLRTRH